MDKLLIIEADPVLRDTLNYHLARDGYEVATVPDGESGLLAARAARPDLVVLDTVLPVLDGFATCRALRREFDTPIVLLAEQRLGGDGIYGLEQGADDFVIKPVNIDELRARLRARLRQSRRNHQPVVNPELLTLGELRVDTGKRCAYRDGSLLMLSQKEFDLLVCLMRYRGLVLPREVLQKHVWGSDAKSDIRTVDVHIRWLREKIEPDPSRPRYIQTVRGAGYRFAEANEA